MSRFSRLYFLASPLRFQAIFGFSPIASPNYCQPIFIAASAATPPPPSPLTTPRRRRQAAFCAITPLRFATPAPLTEIFCFFVSPPLRRALAAPQPQR